MNRNRVSFLVVLFALVVGGCVEERAFYILQNQAPNESCEVVTDEKSSITSGLLDISLSPKQGYRLIPLIKNLTASSQENDPQQPERNALDLRELRINIDASEIPLEFPSDLLSYSVPTSGVIVPGGVRAVLIEAIKPELLNAVVLPKGVRPTLHLEVTAVAARLGTNSLIESSTFNYSVKLCNKCLVQEVLATCPGAEDAFVSNACGWPQDTGPVTCCRRGDQDVCIGAAK
ncbi:MAG: hypothetical protein H6707_06185 [Deltaproteobacteria bacterium]|nr:hypothetical protein [Deltaproteobacteria bacterium]